MKFTFTPFLKSASLVEIYPEPSIKFIPQWYKDMKIAMNGTNEYKIHNGDALTTVKTCVPFLDAITAGYMVTLTEDVMVDLDNMTPLFTWRTDRNIITTHDISQTKNIPTPYGHFSEVYKFESDVIINTPKGYSLFCMHPVNNWDLPFTIISGFVDTDTYSMPIKFPFYMRAGWKGIIEKGTPIAQLIPVKRDKWESEVAPYNEDNIKKIVYKYYSRIRRSYKYHHWVKKDYS